MGDSMPSTSSSGNADVEVMEVTPILSPPKKRAKTSVVSAAGTAQRVKHSEHKDREEKVFDPTLRRDVEGVDTAAMVSLLAVGDKLRRLPVEELLTLNSWTGLGNLAVGEVLEVEMCDTTDTSFGLMALLDCCSKKLGKKKVCAPERYADPALYPCLMVYLGKSDSEKADGEPSRQFHCLRRYGGLDDYGSREAMHKRAEQLRALTVDQLRDVVEVKSVKQFQRGTVFVYSLPRVQTVYTKEGNKRCPTKVWVVSFSTRQDGELVTGEIFVPDRYSSRLEKERQGIMVYRGIGVAKGSGRDFYDLEFLSQREAELLVAE
jgi:hypothetical protein